MQGNQLDAFLHDVKTLLIPEDKPECFFKLSAS